MFLKYFYDRKLAQASYMVGCPETGAALVIDPARDITPYLEAARQEGVRITQAAETHIHADFVSGSRELAHQTGGRLYLSAMGGEDWQYQFPDENIIRLHDGDTFRLGSVLVVVIHTPGHTPEHLVFQITDTTVADRPLGIFSGDFLFAGDVGRPDLLEEAAGIAGTKEVGARQQFHNVQKFKQFPDYLQILPGHGAGSACGKALGAIPSTTLGYEKLFNPAFQIDDEDRFVEWLLSGQPEPPRYFAQMKRVNRQGAALLETLDDPPRMTDENMLLKLVESDALVIDTRPAQDFVQGYLPSTLHVPHTSDHFSTYVGWYVDYAQPVYLIADEAEQPRLLRELRAIGVDQIAGFFALEVAQRAMEQRAETVPQISAEEALEKMRHADSLILDVRGESEYREQHIPGARHIPMGAIPQRLAELPRDGLLMVHCESGVRSQVVASLLQKRGFRNVANLVGGIEAWQKAGLPVEQS
jgi:hydroxyacylglutathione hydrolase